MNTIRIVNPKKGDMVKQLQLDTIQWCIKAVARDTYRENLKHLYIDKDFIAGCDGYRLHIAFNDWDYEPGMYELLTAKANEILLGKSETLSLGDYPSIWRVIPAQCKNGIPSFYCNMDKKQELNNKSGLAYHVYLNTQHCYNLKYLDDIRMEGILKFELGEEMPRMLLVASENHDRLAMIMPLQQ
ncbi:MAG: hypothetical protein ACOYOS_16795 [Syntrophales bacterium]